MYRRKPVLTYALSGNVVGGFGEFGEPHSFTKVNTIYGFAERKSNLTPSIFCPLNRW